MEDRLLYRVTEVAVLTWSGRRRVTSSHRYSPSVSEDRGALSFPTSKQDQQKPRRRGVMSLDRFWPAGLKAALNRNLGSMLSAGSIAI